MRLSEICGTVGMVACFNTAIGYHPMRLGILSSLLNGVSQLQYRNRVSPHAASQLEDYLSDGGEFQYRNRVSPHAAQQVQDRWNRRNAKFQYRNRVSPHAA